LSKLFPFALLLVARERVPVTDVGVEEEEVLAEDVVDDVVG